MATKIDNQFNIKDFVYVVTDPEQISGLVVGIIIRGEKQLLYEVALGIGMEIQEYYDYQLSRDKQVIL